MDRRIFTTFAGLAIAAPRALFAQSAKRVFRIATLDDAVESARAQSWQQFRNRLRELVLAEGNDVAYEARYANASSEQLPVLAAGLVALKPDVIVTVGTPATTAAKRAASSIPIVFIGVGDPVGTQLVASLARPGGNVTGTSNLGQQIAGKQLELLHELAPGARRFALLTDVSNRGSVSSFRRMEGRAHTMNVTIRMLDARKRSDLEKSLETVKREGMQGLVVGATGVLLEHRDKIVQFAEKAKIPVLYGRPEYVTAGGLISYSADQKWLYVRGADYVQRILKGTKPADLPVEQSSNVRMVLNLKTAHALGITVPAPVRLRADEVIE